MDVRLRKKSTEELRLERDFLICDLKSIELKIANLNYIIRQQEGQELAEKKRGR